MTNTTTILALLIPDHTKIVSAAPATVDLLVCMAVHEREAEEDAGKVIDHGNGVLRLSRKVYADATTEFLDEKARYCADGESTGNGSIMFNGVERLPHLVPVEAYLLDGHSRSEDLIPVPLFGTAPDTTFYVQMEQRTGTADADAELTTAAATAAALVAAYDGTPAEKLFYASTLFIGRMFFNAPIGSIQSLLGVVQRILDNAIAVAASDRDSTTTLADDSLATLAFV